MVRPFYFRRFRRLRSGAATVSICLAVLLTPSPTSAGNETGSSARSGVDVVAAAAKSWAADAQLIYLENDESLDAVGASERWGYLYFSPSLDRARGYSVKHGEIVQANDLGMRFEAPMVSDSWLDSTDALLLAEKGAGEKYRAEHGGRLQSMVLMRSVIEFDEPDRTNWMVIYVAEGVPALFVVIDAIRGEVSRTWRG